MDQNPYSLIDRGHCLCFVWCAVANSEYTISIDRLHLINRQPGRPWTGQEDKLAGSKKECKINFLLKFGRDGSRLKSTGGVLLGDDGALEGWLGLVVVGALWWFPLFTCE